MKGFIKIGNRTIGKNNAYIIADMSANHNQDLEEAVQIIYAAKSAGADAVKLQTYMPDTMTMDCHNEYFLIGKGSIWEGRNLYDLYKEAYTPRWWYPRLKNLAEDLNMDLFSTAFDATAVDFLEEMNVPVHKVASFEIVDIPLIEKMAATGKPLIISTGMATLGEIDEAIQAARNAGSEEIALLKCTSAYPAPVDEMNLRTIPNLAEALELPVGLSDHTLGIEVPVAAVALGACIVEKHLTLSRSKPSPDSAFSLEPKEFGAMVQAIRNVEKALGNVHYGMSNNEKINRIFRRSLFVVKDMKAGEIFTFDNLRSIRPSYGLHPRYLQYVLGRKTRCNIKKGTPLSWELIT